MKFFNDLCRPFELKGSKKTGVLLIHGFTDCPAQLRLLGEFLNKKAGYKVKAVLLKGHGTKLEDMQSATYKDWIRDAEKGYRSLKKSCSKVYVIGFSMGALLAFCLAAAYDVQKVVAISPALILKNRKTRFAPVGRFFIKYINKIPFKTAHPKDAKHYSMRYLIAYDKYPAQSLYHLLKLQQYVKKLLAKIACPLLIFKPLKDDLVDPKSFKFIDNKIGSKKKKIVRLKKSGHACQLGPEKAIVHKEILKFFAL